ncbi:MAG: hypothetical protein IJ043_09700 [Clostridia bacterium]|nr:hypothetical protein [Clostridia bacterium]
MIVIDTNLFGAALAFCVGVGIAAVNYGISRYLLKKQPGLYTTAQILKQLLQIGYLVVLFTLGGYTPWDKLWLLVGGCLGITLPMIWFTFRLVRLNDALQRKEDSSDG